ncbi:MAG: reverse transcriptase domain-containing protein, partial [Bacteroidales bacterium]|nr:reverse transcriptase domain-containing protein [Bacteroidales bacterium]
MSASYHFRKIYTKKSLRNLYYSTVRFKSSVGIDRINRRTFEKKIEEHIDIIYRKAKNGSYNFSPYREKLISKGKGKIPRVISIPTIRDKLNLKALYENLKLVYGNETPFVHQIINQITMHISDNQYDGIIRLDVKNFYPSIVHDLLLEQLSKNIKKREIIKLITDAIKHPTVSKSIKDTNASCNQIGVPQGLSVSNILANIYFLPIDRKYKSISAFEYFRYVDDILIVCKCAEFNEIKKEITYDCKKLGLELHTDDPEKSKSCMISDTFGFLGYSFKDSKISVRKKSIDHLRESIIKLFTSYKYSDSHNLKLLKWSVDFRITGCIFNDTKFGWLFFFSQMDDLKLLGSLDHFVKKQAKRFNINTSEISFKKFFRTYNEITNNLTNTKYIPNFD